MMVVVVSLRLLELGEGLLGTSQIPVLQGRGQGGHGVLRAAGPLGALRGGGTLGLGSGALGRELLEGRERRLGTREVAVLQGLAKLLEQALDLSPLALLG